MREFKLIKDFPQNSLGVGAVVREDGRGQYVHNKTVTIFNAYDIEHFPDFWEEVKPKEYEILKVSMYSKHYPIEPLITEVKRLSDGEVFKLNDNTNYGIIQEFMTVIDGRIAVKFYEDGASIWMWLNTIEKKEVLFVTEDNVELFEGDVYYRVNGLSSPCQLTMGKHFSNSHAGAKFFSTEEAAEEYIYRNKPVLSLEDVFKIYPEFKKESDELTRHAEELHNLIKKQ